MFNFETVYLLNVRPESPDKEGELEGVDEGEQADDVDVPPVSASAPRRAVLGVHVLHWRHLV